MISCDSLINFYQEQLFVLIISMDASSESDISAGNAHVQKPEIIQNAEAILNNIYNHGMRGLSPEVISKYLLLKFIYSEELIPSDNPKWKSPNKVIDWAAENLQNNNFVWLRDSSALHAAIFLEIVTDNELIEYAEHRDGFTQNLLYGSS